MYSGIVLYIAVYIPKIIATHDNLYYSQQVTLQDWVQKVSLDVCCSFSVQLHHHKLWHSCLQQWLIAWEWMMVCLSDCMRYQSPSACHFNTADATWYWLKCLLHIKWLGSSITSTCIFPGRFALYFDCSCIAGVDNNLLVLLGETKKKFFLQCCVD